MGLLLCLNWPLWVPFGAPFRLWKGSWGSLRGPGVLLLGAFWRAFWGPGSKPDGRLRPTLGMSGHWARPPPGLQSA